MNREQKEWRKNNPIKAKLKDAINESIGEICKLYKQNNDIDLICSKLHLPNWVVLQIIKKLNLKERYRH